MTQFCKKLKVPVPDTEGCAGITGDFGGAQVVWVDLKQKPKDLVDTVIHESVHVYQHMLNHIGESVTGKETQAYAIAYIASTLLEELEKQYAVHDEWEAGLQEGKPPIQLEAGTNQGEIGTDCNPSSEQCSGDHE